MCHDVLIIDDDHRNIFALSAVLKAKGFRTLSAENMVDAFLVLNNHPSIGIILLDMMMPGMDGYQAAAEIKNNPKFSHTPIIAVTAQAMQGDRERCLAAGANDYVSKPVDVDVLLEKMKKYLK